MGEIKRYLVNLIKKVVVNKFRVKEPVLDTFLPLGIYKLILVGIGGGSSIADGGL